MGLRSGVAPVDGDLTRVLTRLWSAGDTGDATITVGRRVSPGHRLVDTFVAVPNAARPRFLVPTAGRRAMASMLTSYVALRPPATRLLRRTLAAASLGGVVGRVVGDVIAVSVPADLDDDAVARSVFTSHLRARLHAPGALVAMGIPRIDPHYKPTAQLFSAAGAPLGFAKLGWTPATAAMVRRETDALHAWRHRAGGRRAAVPSVLRSGAWNGMPYLVTQPLPADVGAVDDNDPLPLVAREIAGDPVERRLTDSPYWASVLHRLGGASAGPENTLLAALRRAVSVIDDVAGEQLLRFGRWHGDWASWNVACTPRAVHVWDWEHSAPCVPWGFDLLHWQVTVPHLRHGVGYNNSVAAVARSTHLPGVAVPPRILLLAYLIEMGLRSLELRTTGAESDVELYPGLARELSGVATAVTTGGAW